jgi:hypothetical protein
MTCPYFLAVGEDSSSSLVVVENDSDVNSEEAL